MSSAISSRATRSGAALLVGAMACGFDAGMIGYVLPAMRADTHASALTASLLVSVYVVGMIFAIPAAGEALRRFGGRRVFHCCAALAVVGAFIAFGSREPVLLVVARLLQGMGLGPLLPLAAAIVAIEWPSERQGRMMGLLSLTYGVCYLGATVAAPWILRLGWRATFACSCGIAALAAVTRAPAASGGADVTPRLRDTTHIVRRMAPIAAISFGTGIGQALVIFFPMLAVHRHEVVPADSAILMLPLVVAGVGTMLVITAMLDRIGAKTILIAGAVTALGGAVLGALAPAGRISFLVAAALLGAGITALCGGPLRYAAARTVHRDQQGPAQAVVALLTNIGVLAGSSVLGVLGARGSDERAAIEAAMAIACALMAAALSPVIALPAHSAAR